MNMLEKLTSLSPKERELLSIVYLTPHISRKVLRETCGMSKSNFYLATKSLLEAQLLCRGDKVIENVPGRPADSLYMPQDILYIFHVYLTKSEYAFALSDIYGNIVLKSSLYSLRESPRVEPFFSRLSDFYEICTSNSTYRERLCCCGFITGINWTKGYLIRNEFMLPEWFEINFVERIAQTVHAQVFPIDVGNSNIMHLFHTKYKSTTTDMTFFNLSVGIGISFIRNGVLIEPNMMQFSSVEHWDLNLSDEECACGNRGCLITDLGATYIERKYRQYTLKNSGTSGSETSLQEIICYANQYNDPCAISLFERAANALFMLIKLISMLAPANIIVVSGKLFENNPFLMEKLNQKVENARLNGTIVYETMTLDCCVQGCSFYLMNKLLQPEPTSVIATTFSSRM